MLKPLLAFALLAAAGLGGCISDVEDPAQGEPSTPSSPTSPSSDYWVHTLENETVTVRIDTPEGFNMTLGGTFWEAEDFIFGAFFYNNRYVSIISHNYGIEVGHNEEKFTLEETRWSGRSTNYTEWGPGVHTVAFYGQGRPTPINLTTPSGTIEVLENQSAEVRYYNDDDTDWSKNRVYVMPFVSHMSGTLELEPAAKSMEVHALSGVSVRSEIELDLDDETCQLSGFGSVSALTDKAAAVNVDATVRDTYAAQVFVVDWPFDLGGHGCWGPS